MNNLKNLKFGVLQALTILKKYLISKLHIELKKILSNLITVIIPRHINRSENIINDLNKFKLNVVLHFKTKNIKKIQIFI